MFPCVAPISLPCEVAVEFTQYSLPLLLTTVGGGGGGARRRGASKERELVEGMGHVLRVLGKGGGGGGTGK